MIQIKVLSCKTSMNVLTKARSVIGSSPTVGSSKMMIGASFSKIRAKAKRCLSPPEISILPHRPSFPVLEAVFYQFFKPTRSKTSQTSSSLAPSLPIRTLLTTVVLKRYGVWWITPIYLAISSPNSVVLIAFKVTDPAVGVRISPY